MLALNFNAEKFYTDYQQLIVEVANESIEYFYNTATSGLEHKDDVTVIKAMQAESDIIIAKCKFYAEAIMESYGTGESMDKSNPALTDYMNSKFWNSLRKSMTIVGRPAGKYLNILGEEVISTGRRAGKRISKSIPDGKKPSYIIQNAEKRLAQENNYIDRIYQRKLTDFLTNATQYFYNTEVK